MVSSATHLPASLRGSLSGLLEPAQADEALGRLQTRRREQRLDTPYIERSCARSVAEKALNEAEAQLAASPGIRTLGKIVGDFREQRSVWEKDKAYQEGR